MMPEVAASLNLALFTVALSWLRTMDHGDDDDVVKIAHGIVTDTISDSDMVREIERRTGENVRDQLTVKEMEEIAEEVRLLGMGDERN